jgi:hypothetical protein
MLMNITDKSSGTAALECRAAALVVGAWDM